jgi:hypothetical protein
MKRFALLAALLWAGAAFAQNEIEPEAHMSLARGQVRVLQFEDTIQRVNVVIKGVVEAEPLTDRQLAVSGVNAGETRIIVFAQNGRMIYNAATTVTPEQGRIVKIYGMHDKNADLNASYSSVWCHATGCGRPDIDLPKPTAITVERIKRIP